MAGALSTLALTLVVSNLLVEEDAGRFFFYFSALQIGTPVALLGLGAFVVRHIAAGSRGDDFAGVDAVKQRAVDATFLSSCVVGLGVAAVCASMALEDRSAAEVVVALGSIFLAFVLFTRNQLNSFVLQGHSRVNAGIAVQAGLYPAACSLLIALVALFADLRPGASPTGVAAPVLAGAGVLAVGLSCAWRENRTLPFGRGMTDLRMFSPESRALWLLSISIAFVNWSPQVVVGLLEGPEHVTAVTVAQRLAAASSILLMAASPARGARIGRCPSVGA